MKKLTARREYDTINPLSEMAHNGNWVVRDEDGTWVDADKYRNDLLDRYENLEIVENKVGRGSSLGNGKNENK
jgi:hypothetical protein